MIDHDAIVTAFLDALAEHGIGIHDRSDIRIDGSKHRVRADDDKHGQKTLEYQIHTDDPPSGWFRHYRHDVRETFTVRNENRRQITPEERNAMDRERREKRERRQREQEQRWAERAEYCRTLYESASPDDVLSHPYAIKKQWTAAPGIRRIQSIDKSQYFDDKTGVIRDALLVPISSIDKKLWMVQAITPDGTKLFPSGVKKQGHFFPIKGPSDGPILMCEGVATGIALNAATGASVICTLDSGNLIAVDAILAEAAPERQRVACGDNDHGNPKNPGAKKAAQCQCPVLLPQFPLGADGGHTDWDDWLRHHGTPEELKSRLESVLSGPPDEPPEPEYDPDDSIPPADYFEPEPPTVDPGGTAGVYDDGMITFLGWDHSAAYYLPHGMRQPVRLTPSQHTKLNLFALVPNESYWFANYGDADTKRSGGGINWDWAASSMMSRSQARGIYDPGRVRGRGAWFDDGRSVVHAGDKLIVDGQQLGLSEIDSEFIYPVSKPLFVGMTDPAKTAEAVQFVELCEMIRWEEPIFGRLLAGWCFLAPICGAIEWRPHLWLTGPAGSGKSTVLKRIMKPALGGSDGMMIHAAGDTTEAGLRQRLRQDALPVVFDEFEREREKAAARVDDVLALVRQSSSDTGAEIIKGGAGGIADSYLIRSMFAFASIGIGMSSQADESRITVLTMKGSTREQQADPEFQKKYAELSEKISATMTDEFIARLQSRAIQMIPTIRQNIEVFSDAIAQSPKLGGKRLGDQVGTLLAGAYSMFRNNAITLQEALNWINEQQWGGVSNAENTPDEQRCIRMIFDQQIRLEGANAVHTVLVSELVGMASDRVEYPSPDITPGHVDRTLKRHGMLVDTVDGAYNVFFAICHPQIDKLLGSAGSNYKGTYDRILERLPGSSRTAPKKNGSGELRTRSFAGTAKTFVRVPLGVIFEESDDV